MRSYSVLQKHLLSFLIVIVGLSGWITIFYPPLKAYISRTDPTIWEIFSESLKIENSIFVGDPFYGWLFVALSAVLLLLVPISFLRLFSAALRYLDLSERDISILETRFRVRFEDEDLSLTTLTREQLFHANDKKVEAYSFVHSTTSEKGEVVGGSFDVYTLLNEENITGEIITRESRNKIEAIETFTQPLPTSVLATYLPDWLVLFLYNHTNVLDKTVVERHGEIQNLNEYNGEHPMIQLTSAKYSAKNVYICLDFPKSSAPARNDINCFIIREHIVRRIHPRTASDGDRRIFTVYARELNKETLRVQWTNEGSARARARELITDQREEQDKGESGSATAAASAILTDPAPVREPGRGDPVEVNDPESPKQPSLP